MTKNLNLNESHISIIQKAFCRSRAVIPKLIKKTQRIPKVIHHKFDKPKKVFSVPSPDCVAKEIREREKRGEVIKPGFFDKIVCGEEKLRYVDC